MAKRNSKPAIPADALAAIVAARLSVLPRVEQAMAEGRVYQDERGEWRVLDAPAQKEAAHRGVSGSAENGGGAVVETAPPDGGQGAQAEVGDRSASLALDIVSTVAAK